MTTQQVADAALIADRARRAAEARGDRAAAEGYGREIAALCERLAR